MPKVKINSKQGIVAITGSGLEIDGSPTVQGSGEVTGTGLQGVAYSDSTAITKYDGGVKHTDLSASIPAGALITDVGLVCTSAVTGNGTSVLAAIFGTAAAGAELVATKNIVPSAANVAVGRTVFACGANRMVGSAQVFDGFKAAAPLHSSSARTVHCRVSQTGSAATAAGSFRLVVKYQVIK